jgi:transposase
MAKPRKPRHYSAEYKRDAARLVIGSGRSVLEVAEELGVGSQVLGRWVQAERERQEAEKVEQNEPLTFNERFELERLRREKAQLEKDVEFLKKAAAFFASHKHR